MNTPDLITSAEAAEILGVDRSTLTRWSDERLRPEERKLTPVRQLPGRTGTKLFDRSDVEVLAGELSESRTA
ncbi:hypothetical protein [Streptomyces sp.]|uniref:hypothetical protein n=1 Tax=Streptomyces sp. TaxID=1931 RepID=UPI002F9320F0